MTRSNTIPTIDISPWLLSDSSIEARNDIANRLCNACHTCGFFYLVGHGIPVALQRRVFNCAEDLFALSHEEKSKVSIKNSLGLANRGYEELQGQTLQSGMLPDLKEGFFVGAEVEKSDPRAGRFLTGPNQWPQKLSSENFERPLQDFRLRMVSLAETVLRILALVIPGSSPELFDEFMVNPSGNLRLLHYPPQTSTDEKQLGVGAHTDFGGITFLMQQPDTSGLQVWFPAINEWIPVPVKEDSFVVNIGDLLQMWTGGYFKSALHRVVNFGEKHRMSAPFFYNGNIDCKVRALDGSGFETTVEEHIKRRLKESKVAHCLDN